MRAALLVEPLKIEIDDIPVPEPGPGEVSIRVALAGICGSDHSLYKGYLKVPLPVVPGHEAVGRIEKIGSGVSGFKPGERVTIQPNIGCGHCPLCLAGHKNICPSKVRIGLDRNGVFAEVVTAPADYVWKVPEDMPDEVAVFTEPLAVALHGMKLVRPEKGSRTLVFGAGVIGLLAVQLAALQGADVTAMDLEKKRLALAEQLGANHVIGPDQDMEPYQGAFDLIYETSGAPPALAQAINLAAPKGKIVLIGLPGTDHPVSTTLIVRKELQITGSIIYTNEFPQALDLLQKGQVQTRSLATGRLPLSELGRSLSEFSSPDRVKTLIEP